MRSLCVIFLARRNRDPIAHSGFNARRKSKAASKVAAQRGANFLQANAAGRRRGVYQPAARWTIGEFRVM
jgi:hypothetical protein